MKKTILFLLGVLLAAHVFSQVKHYEDVVYLKNGSVIRGIITEQIPNQSIRIETADRNIFVFDVSEIEKMTREEIPADFVPEEVRHEMEAFKTKGFEGGMDVLLAIDIEHGEPVLGLHTHFGYRFIPQLYVGAGTGVELMFDRNNLPLFMQIRTDFVEARVTPFFSANLGYTFAWVNDEAGSEWGGIFIEPEMGVRFNIAKHFGLNLSSAFKFQRGYESYYYYDYSYPEPLETYNREETVFRLFSFKVGFSF